MSNWSWKMTVRGLTCMSDTQTLSSDHIASVFEAVFQSWCVQIHHHVTVSTWWSK
jgi:hypothetical protein